MVSQPDRPRGRGRERSPSPIAACAQAAGIPLLQPERVGDPEVERALRALTPDLGVVVAFGQFVPRALRELPRLGYLVNAHASLLPRHRGAAPIAHAILAGDRETGISVMRVEKEMDAGPVALVRRTQIGEDEDMGSLEARLAELAADAIVEALAAIAAGTITWTPQDAARASFAPKRTREDARLDFSAPAERLVRQVRAFAPRPGAFTLLAGEPLRILAAHAVEGTPGVAPGVVRIESGGRELWIATADGWLAPRVLQRAGGRPLDVADFLRGARVRSGTILPS